MLEYQYEPLQYDSIRILILHPSSNDSDPITCTIKDARPSNTSLEYEALSYTWGSDAQPKEILLDNGRARKPIGENCYHALRSLRLRDKDRQVWIDAICINQEDLEERARQVRMMDEVYRLATGVIVYLGEHTADSRVLFEDLTAADDLQPGDCDHRDPPSEEVFQELDMLYERQWFKRVQVLQEVFFKKGSVTIMCGSSRVSFHALYRLHFGYSRNHALTKSNMPLALLLIGGPQYQYSTPQFSLWYQLNASRNCLATDPRDSLLSQIHAWSRAISNGKVGQLPSNS